MCIRDSFTHILGGLEKDNKTGAISTDPENHDLMTRLRAEKIAKIEVPDVEAVSYTHLLRRLLPASRQERRSMDEQLPRTER